MALVSLAIDYKKSNIEIRSVFSLGSENTDKLYSSILAIARVNHAVILSTCNRTELYLDLTELRAVDDVLDWWQRILNVFEYDLKDYIKLRQGTEVVRHLMKLSCGLESMVLGEPQILGQIKDSYNISKQNNAIGKDLDRVFQKVFATAKRVRRETRIGYCPVSVAFSAVSLAKKQLQNITDKKVLIIGAGDTGSLLFRHISALSPKKIFLANRTIKKAEEIVDNQPNAESHDLSNLKELANKSEIVVAAVSFGEFLLHKSDIDSAKNRVFIDLSIPRILDPKIMAMDNAVYYCVDDIHSVMQDSRQRRQKEATGAEKIIVKSLEEYIDKEKTIVSNGAIKELFEKTDDIIDAALERSIARIKNGKDVEEVIKRFAYELKKKVLHYPVKGMKNASREGREDFLEYMKKMFDLNMEK